MKILLLIGSYLLSGSVAQSQTSTESKRDMNDCYERGDYVNAALNAIDFLRTNAKNKKAQEILSVSFNLAIENLNAEIEELKERSKTFSGDGTVEDRKNIISRYELLRQLDRQGREIVLVIPKQKVPLEFNRVDVTSELEVARKSYDESLGLAAEMHYNRALDLIKNNSRDSQKAAAKEFRRAEEFVSPYKDCDIRYNEAKKLATTRVAIIPFENKSGIYEYGGIGEMTSDKLRATILNDQEASEFIEIYTRDQLKLVFQEHNLNLDEIINQESIAKYGEAMGIHIIITGKVMQISAELKETIHDPAVVTVAEVVVGQEKYIDSKGNQATRNKWGEVSAQNYHHHKSAVAIISGSYEMIDIETARVLASSQFREENKWVNNWITYTGDERARQRVPFGYDNGEVATPSMSELANNVVDQLGAKIAQDVIKLIK